MASIRAFEAVGRLGGIRRAAASLSLDHSVVSRHLRQLEDWLGVALVQRVGGHVSLTDAGTRYHERVSAALADLALATAEISGREDQKRLLVWCVPGFAAQWVTDRVALFEQAYPGYHVELRPTEERANLLAHEADVDIRFYLDGLLPEPGGRGLQHVELARPEVMIVASPTLAAHFRGRITLETLPHAPLLHEDHDRAWRVWLGLNGLRDMPERLHGPLLWHAHLAISAARNSRGLALANPYLVSADLKNGSLVQLNVPGTRPVVIGAYAYVAREDRWSSDGIMRFRHFLLTEAERFGDGVRRWSFCPS